MHSQYASRTFAVTKRNQSLENLQYEPALRPSKTATRCYNLPYLIEKWTCSWTFWHLTSSDQAQLQNSRISTASARKKPLKNKLFERFWSVLLAALPYREDHHHWQQYRSLGPQTTTYIQPLPGKPPPYGSKVTQLQLKRNYGHRDCPRKSLCICSSAKMAVKYAQCFHKSQLLEINSRGPLQRPLSAQLHPTLEQCCKPHSYKHVRSFKTNQFPQPSPATPQLWQHKTFAATSWFFKASTVLNPFARALNNGPF